MLRVFRADRIAWPRLPLRLADEADEQQLLAVALGRPYVDAE